MGRSMKLLICTDLDRTLIPNGQAPESLYARTLFKLLTAQLNITLAYVTGRNQDLVRNAIVEYNLPMPDYIIADVGSSIYQIEPQDKWGLVPEWSVLLTQTWPGHKVLQDLFQDIKILQLQEAPHQSTFKLSYYAPLDCNVSALLKEITQKLQSHNFKASTIWSVDETKGLLDIVPINATKRFAIEFLMQKTAFKEQETIFAGDSGNDLPVLISPIPAILVANASEEIKNQALEQVKAAGLSHRLYLAKGDYLSMNGNYSAGILEGIAHYHPQVHIFLEKANAK